MDNNRSITMRDYILVNRSITMRVRLAVALAAVLESLSAATTSPSLASALPRAVSERFSGTRGLGFRV